MSPTKMNKPPRIPIKLVWTLPPDRRKRGENQKLHNSVAVNTVEQFDNSYSKSNPEEQRDND